MRILLLLAVLVVACEPVGKAKRSSEPGPNDTSKASPQGKESGRVDTKQQMRADLPAVEWQAVLASAKKKAGVVIPRGEAEKLTLQASLSARGARTLGIITTAERAAAVEAVRELKAKGIDRMDPSTVKLAEQVAPVSVELARLGKSRGKADRASVEGVGSHIANLPWRGDLGLTEEESQRLPNSKLTAMGVAIALFDRAGPAVASDYLRLLETGLKQLAFAKAVDVGMNEQREAAPQWHLKRKQAGLAISLESESDLLIKVWAATAILPNTEREAFLQRLDNAAVKGGFNAQQIFTVAAMGK